MKSFVHHLWPRYAGVDVQGVVFNAHWTAFSPSLASACSVPGGEPGRARSRRCAP